MEEAEIYDVLRETSETSAKISQLKRPSESYTTDVPIKRTNKEELHELNDELNYATKPMLDKPNEPMEIASYSSDSFKAHKNIKIKADTSTPYNSKNNARNRKDKDKNLPQNIEDLIEVIEENVPIEKQRMETSTDINKI